MQGELARRPNSHQEEQEAGIGRALELHATPVFGQMLREGSLIPVLREMLIAGAVSKESVVQDRYVRFAAQQFAKLEEAGLREAALLSLGIRARDAHLADLMEVLQDTQQGREWLALEEVPESARAIAAYALGLSSTQLRASRRTEVARLLMDEVLTGNGEARLAAALALGLVELEACGGSVDSDAPHTCPGTQSDVLTSALYEVEAPLELRAHALTSLAKVAARFEDQNSRQPFADLIIEQTQSRADEQLVRSGILALGLFGDCDDDAADVSVRKELARLIHTGPKELRGLATISLAQVSARRITNEDNLEETTKILLHELARGRGDQKAWAALALGVLGNRVALTGRGLDRSVAFGLRERLLSAKAPSLSGACALGLALVRDETEVTDKLLAKRYAKSKDPFFRSHASLALGVLSVSEAVEELEEAVGAGDVEAALALKIMGRDEVVPQLVAALGDPAADHHALIRVLGRMADARAIPALAKLMKSKKADVEIRVQATRALGRIAGEGAGHWTAPYANDLNYRALTPSLSDPEAQRGLLDFRPRE